MHKGLVCQSIFLTASYATTSAFSAFARGRLLGFIRTPKFTTPMCYPNYGKLGACNGKRRNQEAVVS